MRSRMRLRHKILLVVGLAALGFVLTLATVIVLGRRNSAELERIEGSYFPALQVSRDLQELLAGMQRGLQDAVAAADAGAIKEVDGARDRFLVLVGELERTGAQSADELAALRRSLEEYYGQARAVSLRMIQGEAAGEDVVAMLKSMTERYNAITGALAEGTAARREGMRQAFMAAHAASTQTVVASSIILLLALAAMGAVYVWTNRGISRQLGEVEGAMARTSRGDFSTDARIHTSDELGEMAGQMNATNAYLRQATAVASAIASGDFETEVTPRSEADAFGLAARAMSRYLRDMASMAAAIAAGDLEVVVRPQSERDSFGLAFEAMVTSLKQLVLHLRQSVAQVSSAAGELAASSRQHERGAVEQLSAVEETQRTMTAILESGTEVTKASETVLANAELAEKNNRTVAESILTLSKQTQRIAEILEVIKDVANKSELLALNAALEGTKAGEAGRGFSLVANQMQRLAENVMTAVGDIKTLMRDIREASNESVSATEASTGVADQTTQSARQIALVMRQYQGATEQVSQAMENVAEVARQSAAGSKQVLAAGEDLTRLSQQLQTLVDRFKLGSETRLRTA